MLAELVDLLGERKETLNDGNESLLVIGVCCTEIRSATIQRIKRRGRGEYYFYEQTCTGTKLVGIAYSEQHSRHSSGIPSRASAPLRRLAGPGESDHALLRLVLRRGHAWLDFLHVRVELELHRVQLERDDLLALPELELLHGRVELERHLVRFGREFLHAQAVLERRREQAGGKLYHDYLVLNRPPRRGDLGAVLVLDHHPVGKPLLVVALHQLKVARKVLWEAGGQLVLMWEV